MDQFDFLRGVNAGDRHLEQAMLNAQRDRQYESEDGVSPKPVTAHALSRLWQAIKTILSL